MANLQATASEPECYECGGPLDFVNNCRDCGAAPLSVSLDDFGLHLDSRASQALATPQRRSWRPADGRRT